MMSTKIVNEIIEDNMDESHKKEFITITRKILLDLFKQGFNKAEIIRHLSEIIKNAL